MIPGFSTRSSPRASTRSSISSAWPADWPSAEPALGRRVNLDASLTLFDRLRSAGGRPRVVYASSIAVYGDMGAGPVSSETPARPLITYGAHKRMVEIALSDLTRRGEASGIAVRLPGIVARPGVSTGLGSAFMSDLLHAPSPRGEAMSVPFRRRQHAGGCRRPPRSRTCVMPGRSKPWA